MVGKYKVITLCGSTKFMRREFMADTRCSEKRVAEDYDLYMALLAKEPTEKFTNIIVKHYNFPREGSLTNLSIKEKIFKKKQCFQAVGRKPKNTAYKINRS